MIIEQIYTKCLAEAAYYIESDGEAVVIDPLRDITPYVNLAKSRNAKIKYIFETHFHADFVSGHVDLAKATGAIIVIGPTTMRTGYEVLVGQDGEKFRLGRIKLQLIHTPGHTMESSCLLLIDETGKEKALFTGDTLFIGDVGRPDLAQKVIAELTQEKLAGHLYDSLHNKILPLNDDIVVYPGHGAGSACGKKMSDETTDTLGHQKRTNYALDPTLSKEEFIRQVLDGLMPPPGYFPQNVLLNIQGSESMDAVLSREMRPLSPSAFEKLKASEKAIVIDARKAQDFAKAFVPGSINIGIDGSFAVWAGTLIPDLKQCLLVVADVGKEYEAMIRLARVGFDNVLGYLEGGIDSWKKEGRSVDAIRSVDAAELEKELQNEDAVLLDVRKASEYNSEHVIGAENIPLDYINVNKNKVGKQKITYVHCAGGYRSMTFVSMLKAEGWNNLVDVKGGFSALKASGRFQVSEYVSPVTAL
jgi:glyoxylase-like metal-dependent hydrolase (beta-lactamase superfamily II)/rhodanese-related sulfurtransferase